MPLPRLVDALLDRLVVPGWSRIGDAARSAGWRTPPAMDGRAVIVAGASGGLGTAAARGLAGRGARVAMVVRDRARPRPGDETPQARAALWTLGVDATGS